VSMMADDFALVNSVGSDGVQMACQAGCRKAQDPPGSLVTGSLGGGFFSSKVSMREVWNKLIATFGTVTEL
jgi:hypothetical protein